MTDDLSRLEPPDDDPLMERLSAWVEERRATRRRVPPHDRLIASINPLYAAWLMYAPFLFFNRRWLGGGPVEMDIHLAVMMGSRAHTVRRRLAQRYAFAVPSHEVLTQVAAYGPLVEVGAGTGYWAWLLQRDYGVDIVAYDKFPPHLGKNPYGFRREYVPIQRAGVRAAAAHADRALFLCWPPMDATAARSIEYYRGRHVLLIGEGDGGCTGDEALYTRLAADWDEIAEHDLPQWDGIHDYLRVFRRKEGTA